MEPLVTHSNNLTYVHPACHAVGGPSTSIGSSSKTVSGAPKSVAFARTDEGNAAVIEINTTGTGQLDESFCGVAMAADVAGGPGGDGGGHDAPSGRVKSEQPRDEHPA